MDDTLTIKLMITQDCKGFHIFKCMEF